ncbi:MAG: hypothetical protein ABI268_11630 [Rhodanobacter sp.]
MNIRQRIAATRFLRRFEVDRVSGFTGKAAIVLWLVALASTGLSGCQRTPDELQIRTMISAVAEAAESATANKVVAPLSDDFDGNGGELDRRAVSNLVRIRALRGEHIGITTGPITIDHRGQRMVATFNLTLTNRSRLLPDQMGLYQVESAWRKEHGEWRCYSASWKHML